MGDFVICVLSTVGPWPDVKLAIQTRIKQITCKIRITTGESRQKHEAAQQIIKSYKE